jgi:MtN3 and saliva related transmembrane protein
MHSFFTIVGFIAGALTTFAFVPQVLHSYQSRSMQGVSWGMLISFTTGVTLWLVYGLYLHSWPMIIANAVTLCLQAPLIVMKLRYRATHQLDEAAKL